MLDGSGAASASPRVSVRGRRCARRSAPAPPRRPAPSLSRSVAVDVDRPGTGSFGLGVVAALCRPPERRGPHTKGGWLRAAGGSPRRPGSPRRTRPRPARCRRARIRCRGASGKDGRHGYDRFDDRATQPRRAPRLADDSTRTDRVPGTPTGRACAPAAGGHRDRRRHLPAHRRHHRVVHHRRPADRTCHHRGGPPPGAGAHPRRSGPAPVPVQQPHPLGRHRLESASPGPATA